MINIKCTGDFTKTYKFLEIAKTMTMKDIFSRYGNAGVAALSAATPQNTGETASKWGYEIITKKGGTSIVWTNDAISDGIPIAILIQYGHGTKNGGYVSGVDFINPAIKNIMNNLADSIWKEVTKA